MIILKQEKSWNVLPAALRHLKAKNRKIAINFRRVDSLKPPIYQCFGTCYTIIVNVVAIIYIKTPVGVMAGRGAFCLCRLFTFNGAPEGYLWFLPFPCWIGYRKQSNSQYHMIQRPGIR